MGKNFHNGIGPDTIEITEWTSTDEEKEIFPCVEFEIQLNSKKFSGNFSSLLLWRQSEGTMNEEFIDLIRTNYPEHLDELERFLKLQSFK